MHPYAIVCGLIWVIQTFLVLLLLHNNTSNLENKRQTAVIQLGHSLFCNIIPCPYFTCGVFVSNIILTTTSMPSHYRSIKLQMLPGDLKVFNSIQSRLGDIIMVFIPYRNLNYIEDKFAKCSLILIFTD